MDGDHRRAPGAGGGSKGRSSLRPVAARGTGDPPQRARM
ncbi:hypothetical protein FM110_02475 [Brachybacterium nesterenkovii]|uniref:Uncharacterized protein n=1 Tax=Brachybacterium nesterenkovii TaxID=47847 RepID=A0A1X6WUE2_9MICO|nr:hypothetical protein FM110_02475 [Brachybacterium nesterenkovii]